MNENATLFAEVLTERFGDYTSVAGIESTNETLGLVLSFCFPRFPEPELLTGITYGLSEASHSVWGEKRPELVITVRSADESWVHAIGYLAEWHREKHPFSPGSLFHYGKPIAPDSLMDSFLIFEPATRRKQSFASVQLPDRQISFLMVYPLYFGEVPLIQKVGIRKFMDLPQYDFFDVNRPDLSALYRVG
jgi:hypothetical protein